MKVRWVVDANTTVDGDFSAFGHEVIKVNGTEVLNRWNLFSFRSNFQWPDGRPASMSVQFSSSGVGFALSLDGVPIATTPYVGKLNCTHCGASIASGVSECAACGGAQPSDAARQQQYASKRLVGRATAPLLLAALLTAGSGVLRTMHTRAELKTEIQQLEAAEQDVGLDRPRETEQLLHARSRLNAVWLELSFMLVVAGGYLTLAFWAKHAPLAAWGCGVACYLGFIAMALLQGRGLSFPSVVWDVILAVNFALAWPAAQQLSKERAAAQGEQHRRG